MRKRTKALTISQKVKAAVFNRDGGKCIVCGRFGSPCAHYISRAQGGLGIEENIVTLCDECHRRFDQTADRKVYRDMIAAYLRQQYPGWDEKKLIYRKYEVLEERKNGE